MITSNTGYYGNRKLPRKKVFFVNFLPATFVNQTFCVRSLWGEENIVQGTGGM